MNTPLYTSEPRWHSQAHYCQTDLPAAHRHWLLDQGSLTDHLVRASQGQFAVERLSQTWAVPTLSERQRLGMKPRQLALIREVALLCNNQAWVFARSVIPLATLNGPLRHLRKLHNQSLGSFLFKRPNLGRSPFELALLPAASPYIHSALSQSEAAWARRSRLAVGNARLLVSEVFLDAFQPWSQGSATLSPNIKTLV